MKIFCREKNAHRYKNIIFNKIYEFDWNIKAKYKLPFNYQTLKKKINSIISQIRPDIIQAHSIFPAKLSSEFEIPSVFDVHEFSSNHSKVVDEMFRIRESQDKSKINKIKWFARMSIKKYMSKLWSE